MTRSKMAFLLALTTTGAALGACGGDDNANVDLGAPDAGDATAPKPVDSGKDTSLPGTDASEAGSDAADSSSASDAGDASDASNADSGKTLDGGSCNGPNFTVSGVDPQFGWTGGKTALS